MSCIDWLIIAVIGVWFILAVRKIIKNRGGCSCGEGCSENCASCAHECSKNKHKN